MGNTMIKFNKNIAEFKQSYNRNTSLYTTQQRIGDRYLRSFIATFIVASTLSIYTLWLESAIEQKYSQYRTIVDEQI